MNTQSPYFITTNLGKLELTKGSYLTLMKRKNSICKTLQKSKQVSCSFKNYKKTLKKDWKNAQNFQHTDDTLITQHPRKMSRSISKIRTSYKSRSVTVCQNNFRIKKDKQIFQFPMLDNVPLIQMECDNDCESQWPQIHNVVDNLAISLSLAAYDNRMSYMN